MLAIKDLTGEVYLLTGASDIKRIRRVNGEKELYLKLDKTRQNEHFFDDVEKLWRVVDFNGDEYPIMMYRDEAVGDGYQRELSCLHSFFDDMRNHVIYESFSGSRTFAAMMDFIFAGSGYSYNIIDFFYAQDFENFGDDYGLELFKDALDRYGSEFSVSGKTVSLRAQIGNVTDFQYRHKFNLESVEREVDALDFSTYGEAFGKDGLHVIYRSPLADIYGERPIKAIRDERYTNPDSLMERLKEAVDGSLRVTLTVKLADLRASGYNKNQPDEGDTIILVDNRFGLQVDTRIVEIEELLDKDGEVLDCDVTLSNFSNVFEQQRRIHNATKTIADAIEGKRPFPFVALDIAVQQATIALQNVQSELVLPSNGGIHAIDKSNLNKIVTFNAAGLGISNDAGKTYRTAITGDGIVADVITAGTLRGVLIEGVEIRGSLIESREDINGGENFIRMNNNTLQSHGIYTRTWAGVEEIAMINLGIRRGQLWISNEDNGYNLYFTERGLSTSMSGAIDQFTSGTLEFHSQRFNETSRGVTLHSSYGTVALLSDFSSVVSRSALTNNVESRQFSVYVRPYMETRDGVNEFQFYVKDNPGASETDGALLYGNLTEGATHGSGLRFSKQSSNPTIYATNNAGDIGTGDFHARNYYGVDFNGYLKAPGTYAYIMTAYDGALRVTDKNGYNNGLPNYRDLEVAKIRAENIRTINGENFYVGVSEHEMRVTNNLFYNAGDTGYKPVRASEFINASSIEYKTDVSLWDGNAREILRNEARIYQYKLKDDVGTERDLYRRGMIIEKETPVEFVYGKGVNHNEIFSFLIRAFQQEADANDERFAQLETKHLEVTNKLTLMENRLAELESA